MELSLITQMQDQSQHFSNTTRANGFSLPKVQYPPKTFMLHIKCGACLKTFLKALLETKKLNMKKLNTFIFFLASYLFTFPLTKLFISSSIF